MISMNDFKPCDSLLFLGWRDKPKEELEMAWYTMTPEQQKQFAFTAAAEYNALLELYNATCFEATAKNTED